MYVTRKINTLRLIALCIPLLGTLLAIGGCGGGGSSGGSPAARGPSISSFSPLSGAPGTAVTITGLNFGSTPGDNTTAFNNTTATLNSATTTQIVAVVPASATSGPISVTTTSGTAYSMSSFSVISMASAVPAAPTGVTATAGNTQVTITWSPVTGVNGANSYNIYWSTTPGVTKLNGNKFTSATSPYIQTGLANGTAVYYVVTAVNSAGESADSLPASATPVPPLPAAPTGVSAVPANAQNSIFWNASSGATSYNVYWSTTTGVTKANGTKITGATSPYVHSVLSNGTAYFYVVTAVNTAGESADSTQVSATPVAPVASPAAPSGVSAAAGNAQATLSWSTVSGAISYNVYWSTMTGVTKLTGTKITSATNPYVHALLTNGATYYYVVTAVNTAGESADSVQVSATPVAPAALPVAPSGVSAIAGNAQATLSWSAVTGATSYNLYWSTTTGVTKLTGTKITGATNPYVHTLLTNGTTYYYVVTSLNANGESADSAQVGVVPTATTNVWATKAPMPVARFLNTVAGIGNLLYAAGGTNYVCGAYSTLEVYDPATNTWAAKASMLTARWALSSGVVNGILYAVGGTNGCYNPNPGMNTVEAYDPATNTWTAKAPMPTTRRNFAVGVVNGILYAVGGIGNAGIIATVEAYNPTTNTWSTKAPLPVARYGIGVGVVNGILYAVGGNNYTTAMQYATVDAYNPATDTWSTVAPLPASRSEHAVGVVNGILYAVGGYGAYPHPIVAMAEAYNPVTNTWTAVASMPTARTEFAGGVVNNILYVVGGGTTGGPVATVEAYTP